MMNKSYGDSNMSALRNNEIYHAPFFGEYGDASEEDDALAKQPDGTSYNEICDRIIASGRHRRLKQDGTEEAYEEEEATK